MVFSNTWHHFVFVGGGIVELLEAKRREDKVSPA
jgi:hypothetical protein